MDDQIIIMSKRQESKRNSQPVIALEQAEPVTLTTMLMEKDQVIQEQYVVLEKEVAEIEAKEVIG